MDSDNRLSSLDERIASRLAARAAELNQRIAERAAEVNQRLADRAAELEQRIGARFRSVTPGAAPRNNAATSPRASSGTRYGLYVGIDHYAIPANTLHGCVVDANNMAAVCRDLGGWKDENQTLLTDERATLDDIRASLHSLADKARPGDVVLYYHSSHGGPNGGNVSSNDTLLFTHDGSYQEATLREDLCRFRKGVNLIVIVDACYSGGLIRGPASNGMFPAGDAMQTRMDAMVRRLYQTLQHTTTTAADGGDHLAADDIGWITAVDNGQSAVDMGSAGGLFTSQLLIKKGWRDGQADRTGRGFVMFLDLAEYTCSASQAIDPTLSPQYHNPDLLRSVVAGRTGSMGCGTLHASCDLRLPSGITTIPSDSVASARAALVSGKGLSDDSALGVYLIQIPMDSRSAVVRKAIDQSGAKRLRAVSGGAYLVRATKAQYLSLLSSGTVAATRAYLPADKEAPPPTPVENRSGSSPSNSDIYEVSLFPDSDISAIRATVGALEGCSIPFPDETVLRVRATPEGRDRLAALPDVEALTPWVEPVNWNERATEAMHIHAAWPSSALRGTSSADPVRGATSSGRDIGLTGKGQVIAVCDSGLDTGDPTTLHPDVRGRVLKAFAYGRPSNKDTWAGDWSDHNGHGTHVVGSVLGDGSASGGRIKGPAFEASLVLQSHTDSKGSLSGLARRGYLGVLKDAYEFRTPSGASPRIHSNSWGAPVNGLYEGCARAFDIASFVAPDFLPVVAAGNNGVDAKPPFGVVDPRSMGTPGTAKNVLTVGATENDGSGGVLASQPYGRFWSRCFSHEPLASDASGSSPHGAPRGMAAFSSRGPCADGRIKPDVVAPGIWVDSIRSSVAKTEPPMVDPGNDRYRFMCGTSMSTPLVAGTVALVRQWLVEKCGVPDPDAATLKALLCAGAKSLAPGQYGDGPFREIPDQYPNHVEGWGMVDLENTIANPDGIVISDGAPISEGALVTAAVRAPGGHPLSIVMAYSDCPSMPGAGGLINDLDLTVTDPSGKVWFPNSLSGPDHVNNVEGVRWKSAPAGIYTIHIRATSILEPMDSRFTGGLSDATRFSVAVVGANAVDSARFAESAPCGCLQWNGNGPGRE